MSIPESIALYMYKMALTTVAEKRISDLLELAEDLSSKDGPVNRLFISEFVDTEGARNLENVWFFTERMALEAKNFLAEDDLDGIIFADNIHYWHLKKVEFHPKVAPSPKSRLTLTVSFGGGGTNAIDGELKASGDNCPFLYSLAREVFASNLMP
ncbi:hypothetical protein [Microbispora sp. NPDC049125]|uniref:hypothetical protein n=1 Tax=Microbispora sp. NPDC049125 TaxID=3154929 RepID=UPI0034672089